VISKRPRVVFDCNVLLQAVANEEGPAAECLRLLDAGRITVFLSRATLKELRAVLEYPSVREKLTGLSEIRIAAFLERLTYRATLVRRVPHALDYSRARQDEPYIDLAVAAKANYLVSRDNDLLSLMTGHSLVCKRFRQLTHPLRVLDPVAFLEALTDPKRPT
jgi:putative PIN family toxin of toxin-antitoxin system